MKFINVKAPTRVDLGGGTLDIWPLYLLHKNSCTVNIAINLLVDVSISFHNNNKCSILLNNKKLHFNIKELSNLPHRGEFQLINNIVKFFAISHPFDLHICIATPRGSGLGTSSSLAIALCKAFQIYENKNYSPNELIDLAMSLETQILQLPTGKQDYLAAYYGGVNCWQFGPLGFKQNNISINYTELAKRSVLCYVGKPHYSASANWMIFKNRLEKNNAIINRLNKIRDAALEIYNSISNQDWNSLANAINNEWSNRKRLTPGLETHEMKNAISIAVKYGATAAKGCGAASGGTIYFLVDPDAKSNVENALRLANYEVLPFEINTDGLTYTVS